MVADTRPVGESVVKLAPRDLVAEVDCLEHRDIRLAPPAQVIDGRATRIGMKRRERSHYVVSVDVVAHLLAAIAKDRVGSASDSALHEVGEKAVQLRASVLRAGQAAA